jgi:hypothetical protein
MELAAFKRQGIAHVQAMDAYTSEVSIRFSGGGVTLPLRVGGRIHRLQFEFGHRALCFANPRIAERYRTLESGRLELGRRNLLLPILACIDR